MHISRPHRISLVLLALVLVGAGCGRGATRSPSPPPQSGESRPVTPPPPPIAQFTCPITPALVRAACQVDYELSAADFPCAVSAKIGGSGISFPFFQVVIRSFREFAPGLGRESGTLNELLDLRRRVMNEVVEQQGAGLFRACDRIETQAVPGLGDEAFLAPLTLIGCDASRVSPRSNIEQAPWLFIRKGNTVAEVVAFQGDTEANPGCSSAEVLNIAREHVLPAMNP